MTTSLARKTVRAGICASLIGLSSLASAATSSVFQGVTFTADWTGSILNIGMNTSTLLGDWVGATHIEAIAINDTGNYPDANSVTLAGPGTFSGPIDASGLNAGGCHKIGQTAPHPCWTGKAGLGGTLIFSFDHKDPSFNANPHLKVFFTDGQGNKVGSLYSQDISDVAEVPLPAAAWLFGSGLVGLAGIARKRKAKPA
jgi:hypothetical protein